MSSFHVIYSYSDLLSQKVSYFLCSVGIFTFPLSAQNRFFWRGKYSSLGKLEDLVKHLKFLLGTLKSLMLIQLFGRRMIVTSLLVV